MRETPPDQEVCSRMCRAWETQRGANFEGTGIGPRAAVCPSGWHWLGRVDRAFCPNSVADDVTVCEDQFYVPTAPGHGRCEGVSG